MTIVELLMLGVIGVGSSILLGEIRWFRQGPDAPRVRPYAPPTTAGSSAGTRRWAAGAVLIPLAQQAGSRISTALGVTDDLGTRLDRAGLTMEPAVFRMRQLTHALAGLAAGAAVALAVRPGAVAGFLLVLGCPVLWVLRDEQVLGARAAERRRRLQLELPVVAEQLGLLVDAGYSLPSALARIARRGHGIAADDLRRVTQRIRQGLSEGEALGEWARRTDLDPVRRLVGVLALHREAGDLGRLIAAEARSIRAESHRALVERIERRSQLVWVPVTVATLVPGLLFLAVPFVSALSRVTGT